ncbi:hypothetical protein [Arabidopsis thaliana]|nr:hypothetical protein [Arabidopsis thaliana]CAB78699.1 hypothetical protein [Arabidopsis thaliana]
MSPLSSLPPKTFISSFHCHSVTRLRRSVTARTMSSQSSQRVFQLRQDPLTGNSEWIVIEDNDQPGTSTDGLLATTSYLDMLNDSRRNIAYRLAIEKTITEPCHVLDIGFVFSLNFDKGECGICVYSAGTGLLSMMAVRAMRGDSKGMVTACESYLPMVKLMRKVMHKNGMTKNINLINKRSDELKVGSEDIASRADVLKEITISLIPSLQHAHDMLLVDNPKTVPYRATTYCQLVESTFLCNLQDLRNNEAKTSDGVRLVPPGLESLFGIKSQQYSMHVDAIEKEIKLLDSEGTIFYSTAPRWIDSNSEIEESLFPPVAVHSAPLRSNRLLITESFDQFWFSFLVKQVLETGVTIGNSVFGLLQEQACPYPKEKKGNRIHNVSSLMTVFSYHLWLYIYRTDHGFYHCHLGCKRMLPDTLKPLLIQMAFQKIVSNISEMGRQIWPKRIQARLSESVGVNQRLIQLKLSNNPSVPAIMTSPGATATVKT